MARRNPPPHPEYPYHISARTNNATWFHSNLGKVWEIFEDQLFFIHHAYGIKIHSFVLMSNHYHLILSDPQLNIQAAMGWFMTETSKSINQLKGTKNHLWGRRNYRTRIDSNSYFLHAYKYVYRNPVEAGICSRPEDYPFSTLHGLMGKAKLLIPLYEDTLLGQDLEGTLQWLNRSVNPEDRKTIKTAFKRRIFKLSNIRSSKLPHRLEKDSY
jgi:putative transposase